jgi:magnesium-transporting ATPase (P-type)
MLDRNERAIVGLALFRAFVGGLVVSVPWVVGNGLDAYGMTEVATGVALVAAAPLMHRAQWLRWVQAALAMALFFTPFAFGEAVSDRQIYCAVLLGHMVLITAIVTPTLFRQEEEYKPSTSASELSRSAASNTSSVSTPPN